MIELFKLISDNKDRFEIIRNVKYVKSNNTILIDCNVGKCATLELLSGNRLYIESDKKTQQKLKTIIETLLQERNLNNANTI